MNDFQVPAPRYYSAFGPVVDRRSILPDSAASLMNSSTQGVGGVAFESTSLLVVLSPRLPGAMATDILREQRNGEITDVDRRRFLRTYVQNVFEFHRQKIYDILSYQYTDWERGTSEWMVASKDRLGDGRSGPDHLLELINDGQYSAPAVDVARLHASQNDAAPTYVFSFVSTHSRQRNEKTSGTPHNQIEEWNLLEDLEIAFGAPLTDGISPWDSSYTYADKLLSYTVIRYWTSFIKSG